MADEKTPTAEQSVAGMVDLMHKVADGARPQGPQLGIVLAPPPEIQIKLNNIILTKKDIYIDEHLLPWYVRHYVGETQYRAGGSGMAAYESHNHPIHNDLTLTDTLKVGDLVSVYPLEGDQLYFVESKVVRL
ncbi:MAG: DUF2577 domain-containing protein [Acidaminococcaceae bacterium]|nr:DUF2577 domain-containing protein [Acidaminococcaceae bacterium]